MSSAGIEIVGPRVDINPPGGGPDGGPGKGTPVEADIMKGGALKAKGLNGKGQGKTGDGGKEPAPVFEDCLRESREQDSPVCGEWEEISE
jgi:hypothetical protein